MNKKNELIFNTLQIVNKLSNIIEVSYIEVDEIFNIKKEILLSTQNRTLYNNYKNYIKESDFIEKLGSDVLFYSSKFHYGYLLITHKNTGFHLDEVILKAKQNITEMLVFFSQIFKDISQLNLFKNIFNSIPMTIAYKDMNHFYQIVSKTVDDLYKDRFDTIVGKSVFEIYPEKEAKTVLELDKEAMISKKLVRREVDVFTQDGFLKIDAFRMPIFSEKEEMLGVLSLGFDISELDRIRNKLERNNRFQQVILNLTKSFVNLETQDFNKTVTEGLSKLGSSLNADRVRIFNFYFQRDSIAVAYQWTKERHIELKQINEMKISTYHNVLFSDDFFVSPFITDSLESNLGENKYYKELSSQNIVSTIILPIVLQNKSYGFIQFDSFESQTEWISDELTLLIIPQVISSALLKNQYDIKLQKEIKNAVQASEAKSNFLAVMSHEIRTPISGVNNAHQLLETTLLSNEQKEYLQISQLSLDSLSSLVNNILDYSKIESKKITYQSSEYIIEDMMYEIIHSQKHLSDEKGIKLKLDFDYNIVDIYTFDVQKLKQVLLNLVNNAIKFTNEGEVKIVIKIVKDSKHYSDIAFEVIDTGIGIKRTELKKLFDKFYQTDSSLSRIQIGTGLGLSIANELTDFLGGKLIATSKVGLGSNFNFTLSFQKSNEKVKFYKEKKSLLYVDYSPSNFDFKSYFKSMNISSQLHNESANYSKSYYNNFDIILFNIHNTSTLEMVKNTLSQIDSEDALYLLISNELNTVRQVNKLELFDYVLYSPISRSQLYKKISIGKVYSYKKSSMFSAKFKNKKCLLVDDNKLNRKALSLLLEKKSIEVHLASNGIDAIELSNRMQFDIILMDLQMPIMNGFEAKKIISESSTYNKTTPIIAVTANSIKEIRQKCESEGFQEVLPKPFDNHDLQNILSKYINTNLNINIEPINSKIDFDYFNAAQFEIDFNNSKIINDIIDTFIEETSTNLQELKKQNSINNYDEINRIIHYLKSSFGYMRANNILVLSNDIMSEIEHKNYKTINEKVVLYMESGKLFIEEVKKYKESKK